MSETSRTDHERHCAALPLLAELTAWRRAAGYDPAVDGAAEIRSSGESNAALDRVRRELDALGVHYHWCPECAEYHLVLGEPAGSGE